MHFFITINKTPPSNRGRENKQQEQKWHLNREVSPDSRVRKPVPGTWKALHLFCPQNVRDQYFNEIIIHATATNKRRHISIHLLIYWNSLRCISASIILLQQRATTVNTPPLARRAIPPQFVGALLRRSGRRTRLAWRFRLRSQWGTSFKTSFNPLPVSNFEAFLRELIIHQSTLLV